MLHEKINISCKIFLILNLLISVIFQINVIHKKHIGYNSRKRFKYRINK